MTRDEVQALLDTADHVYPDYAPLFLCAVRTGMRLGELVALQWERYRISSSLYSCAAQPGRGEDDDHEEQATAPTRHVRAPDADADAPPGGAEARGTDGGETGCRRGCF